MTRARLAILPVVAAVVLAAAGGCGEDDPSGLQGKVVTGPGVRAVPPPFPADKTKLAQRIRLLGLPPVGSEKFHQHAQLRVYVDGLLTPVPSGVGLDNKRKVFSSLHTHNATGVLHLEADTPFKVTLGDLFAIWGLAFGPDHIGSLENGDGRKLRTYVNGRPVENPAAQPIRKNDNIVVAFGTGDEKIDVTPDTTALKDANNGKGGCSSGGKGKKPTSCIVD